jgi:hypothetical protein
MFVRNRIMPTLTALAVTALIFTGCASSSEPGEAAAPQPDAASPLEAVDPIEQARVVLGGQYSYDTVKAATDGALTATGLGLTDANRNSAWSSVLAVIDGLSETGYSVAGMDVMLCVPGVARAGSTNFPDAAALCATEIAVS